MCLCFPDPILVHKLIVSLCCGSSDITPALTKNHESYNPSELLESQLSHQQPNEHFKHDSYP